MDPSIVLQACAALIQPLIEFGSIPLFDVMELYNDLNKMTYEDYKDKGEEDVSL